MNLTVKEKYVEIDDVISIQKGSATRIIKRRANPIGVSLFLPFGRILIQLEGTTIEGAPASDNNVLYDFLKTNLFSLGGGSGEGLQKAVIEDMQEGTNNEKYVTPMLTSQFVSWFSEDLIKIDDTSFVNPPTSEEMNILYPDTRVRTTVYLEDVNEARLKYTKLNDEQWESQPYTIA